jgi:DNA-directed RNA polymerase subunit RPC12/RpoP
MSKDLGDYKSHEYSPPDSNGRVLCEFYCAECFGYVYVKLNTALEGNHVVNCPNCGHKHYRVVKDGIITDCRFSENHEIADEIVPMRSAWQKERRPPPELEPGKGAIALIRQFEAVGYHR